MVQCRQVCFISFLIDLLNCAPWTTATIGKVTVTVDAPHVGVDLSPIFTCEVSGSSPLPQIENWTHGSANSPTLIFGDKFIRLTSGNDVIMIKNVQKADEGTYYCNALSNGQLISASVKITVIEAPVIRAYDAIVREGSPAALVCNGSNYDVVNWTFRGKSMFKRPGTNMQGLGEMLRFAAVTRADNGTYECTASNIRNKSYAKANLIVEVPPEVGTHPIAKTVNLGDDVKFTCVMAGFPLPDIGWMRNGVPVPALGRFKTSVLNKTLNETSSELAIQNVQANDSGLYYCISATTAGGSQSNSAQLTVANAPTPRTTNSKSYKTLYFGRNAFLGCKFTLPAVAWKKDGNLLTYPSTSRYFQTPNGLAINGVTFEDSGVYICHKNTSSDLLLEIQATVVGPPDSPSEVHADASVTDVQGIFSLSIFVNWTTPAFDGNSPLTGYVVYWKYAGNAWRIGKNHLAPYQTSALLFFKINEIEGVAAIEIRVEAENLFGRKNSTKQSLSEYLLNKFLEQGTLPAGTGHSLTTEIPSTSQADCCRSSKWIVWIWIGKAISSLTTQASETMGLLLSKIAVWPRYDHLISESTAESKSRFFMFGVYVFSGIL
eukprot:m.3749 g.3749  ORF g.3749 m.3749 type:complete len:603 (+) comp9768_c0_seq1:76-1884(+)